LNYACVLDSSREDVFVYDRYQVIALTGNLSLRLNVFVEVGLNKREPLLDTAFNITSTLSNIAEH
jgi:hypothetical protein